MQLWKGIEKGMGYFKYKAEDTWREVVEVGAAGASSCDVTFRRAVWSRNDST